MASPIVGADRRQTEICHSGSVSPGGRLGLGTVSALVYTGAPHSMILLHERLGVREGWGSMGMGRGGVLWDGQAVGAVPNLSLSTAKYVKVKSSPV